MVEYVFRSEFQTFKNAKKADPQVIGEAIAKLGGKDVRPAQVVEAARARNHPLHKHFEWDDTKAAHSFRLSQARAIISCVSDKEHPKVQAFVSIKSAEGRSYQPIARVVSSVEMQMSLMKDARRDLQAFRARYGDLSEICDFVEEAIRKIDARLGQGQPAAA